MIVCNLISESEERLFATYERLECSRSMCYPPFRQRIGTAIQDAFRRDLTINSMFYNINEGKVEDFTKMVVCVCVVVVVVVVASKVAGEKCSLDKK